MKKKLIALSDGHGKDTPGKRSPNGMQENEFNKVVVMYLQDILENCGFDTLLVAPGDKDVPLQARTDLANEKNADLYISIHANAKDGKWFNGGGIETYHLPRSVQGKKLAQLIQTELIKGTKLTNRGVKSLYFHELRETKMPAALIEAGFMDSRQDITHLLSDAYRKECAIEVAKGICNYFGVPFTEAAAKEAEAASVELYKVQVGAFSSKKNAAAYAKKLVDKGIGAIVVKG